MAVKNHEVLLNLHGSGGYPVASLYCLRPSDSGPVGYGHRHFSQLSHSSSWPFPVWHEACRNECCRVSWLPCNPEPSHISQFNTSLVDVESSGMVKLFHKACNKRCDARILRRGRIGGGATRIHSVSYIKVRKVYPCTYHTHDDPGASQGHMTFTLLLKLWHNLSLQAHWDLPNPS